MTVMLGLMVLFGKMTDLQIYIAIALCIVSEPGPRLSMKNFYA